MTRTEALCKALGWQGGTIHQVSEETGCTTSDLLYGKPAQTHLTSDYTGGWFAGRTSSLEHNRTKVFPKYKGNLDFWLGIADGLKQP